MSKLLPCIAIVHCGDDSSRKLSDRLVNSRHGQKFTSRDIYINDRDMLIFHYLQHLVGLKSPLLLFLSSSFFQFIWKSALKTDILKIILNYPSKYHLDVWMEGITDDEVKKYSTGLLRSDAEMKKVTWQRIKDLDTNSLIDLIIERMTDTSHEIKFEQDQNFSIQDYDNDSSNSPIDKRLDNFINLKEALPQPQSSISLGSKKGKKKRNESKNFYAQAATKPNSTSLSHKMLKNLSYEERSRIASLLNVGFGANWKQIANLYGLDVNEIRQIDTSRRDSPTELLFQLLFTRVPNLTLEDLRLKCKAIMRMDVASLIDEYLE